MVCAKLCRIVKRRGSLLSRVIDRVWEGGVPPDPRSSVLLRRGALDVRRPRTLRAVGHLELDAVTLAQICDALAVDSALVKEIFLPRLTLDEPKPFVHSQRPNCSCHLSISCLWFLTIASSSTRPMA